MTWTLAANLLIRFNRLILTEIQRSHEVGDMVTYTDLELNLSLTNTRANCVRHALARMSCPFCGSSVMLLDSIVCGCGFTVPHNEVERQLSIMHRETEELTLSPVRR